MRGMVAKKIRSLTYGENAHHTFVRERRESNYGVVFNSGFTDLGPFIVHTGTGIARYKQMKKAYRFYREHGLKFNFDPKVGTA